MAITDGWHADRSHMSGVGESAESTPVGLHPTPEQVREIDHANAIMDRARGPGACVPESRHRLILSGLGLGALAVICSVVVIARRLRRYDGESSSEETDQRVSSFV